MSFWYTVKDVPCIFWEILHVLWAKNRYDALRLQKKNLNFVRWIEFGLEWCASNGVWSLTDIPNCSRAMRMTSLVVSMLLTARVLAWTSRNTRNWPHLQNWHLVAILLTAVGTRGATYIGTVANILGENLQWDGLGVISLFSIDYSTARLKNGERTIKQFSLQRTFTTRREILDLHLPEWTR